MKKETILLISILSVIGALVVAIALDLAGVGERKPSPSPIPSPVLGLGQEPPYSFKRVSRIVKSTRYGEEAIFAGDGSRCLPTNSQQMLALIGVDPGDLLECQWQEVKVQEKKP